MLRDLVKAIDQGPDECGPGLDDACETLDSHFLTSLITFALQFGAGAGQWPFEDH